MSRTAGWHGPRCRKACCKPPCARCGEAYGKHEFYDNRRRCWDGLAYKPGVEVVKVLT